MLGRLLWLTLDLLEEEWLEDALLFLAELALRLEDELLLLELLF